MKRQRVSVALLTAVLLASPRSGQAQTATSLQDLVGGYSARLAGADHPGSIKKGDDEKSLLLTLDARDLDQGEVVLVLRQARDDEKTLVGMQKGGSVVGALAGKGNTSERLSIKLTRAPGQTVKLRGTLHDAVSKKDWDVTLTRREGAGLCLSGGGFRATLFHLGALRRLNELGLLSKMKKISSVSGGSIANGLLAKWWPKLTRDGDGKFTNLDAFEADVRAFCSQDLRDASLSIFHPTRWAIQLDKERSTTEFYAASLEKNLVPGLRVSDLVAIKAAGGPEFIFNATNYDTGAIFTFSASGVGDEQIGFAPALDARLADAVAASSAFPMGFAPLLLKMDPTTFKGGLLESVAKDDASRAALTQMRRLLHLADGGIKDNLGVVAVWADCATVYVSDAGKPDGGPTPVKTNSVLTGLLQAEGAAESGADSVRHMWLMDTYGRGLFGGAAWGIKQSTGDFKEHRDGYAGEALRLLSLVRTDLNAFTPGEQGVLMNHGWLLADASVRSFAPDQVKSQALLTAGQVPAPDLLDGARAARELQFSAAHFKSNRTPTTPAVRPSVPSGELGAPAR